MITLPEAFKVRMRELLGEEYDRFEASYEKERVQGLRFNSLKSEEGKEEDWEQGSVPKLAALVEKRLGTELSPVLWAKEGYIMGRRPDQASIPTMRQDYTISRSPAPWR